MQSFKIRSSLLVVLVAISACIATREPALAELHWQAPKKEHMRLRLVALAIAYPRSSYFSSQEVFVAEQQIDKDETRLIKLVYNFLPYQPRLSEYGMEYLTVHEMLALRDQNCDETLKQIGYRGETKFKYAEDSPKLDVERQRGVLRCYQTTAEDYNQPLH
jgi:hypothetical protein